MTVTTNGVFLLSPENGWFLFGSDAYAREAGPTGGVPDGGTTGLGSLGVTNTTYVLSSSNTAADPLLRVGDGLGSNGIVSVVGPLGLLRLDSNSVVNDWGTLAYIGVNDGTGSMEITGGATFEILDSSTSPITLPNGSEALFIGRSGGTGTVEVYDGSAVKITGGFPGVQVGRDGGTGTFILGQNSLLEITGMPTGVSSYAGMDVGRGASANGLLELIDGSQANLTSQAEGGAYFRVGMDGGAGVASILSGSSLHLDGGIEAYVGLGRFGEGTGHLTIAGAGSHLQVHTASGFGGIDVGSSDATGYLDVLDGGSISISSDAGAAYLGVGAEFGTAVRTGTLVIDDGSIDLFGGAGAGFNVGVGSGSWGDALLTNGASVFVTSSDNSSVDIGRNGGEGSLTIEDGSEVLIVAPEGTTGNASFTVGRGSGSEGSLDVLAGSSLILKNEHGSEGSGSWASVGREGGSGSIVVSGQNSLLRLESAAGAGLSIGTSWPHEPAQGGEGSLIIENGGRLEFRAIDTSGITLGGSAGTAELALRSGGVLDFGQGSSYIQFGSVVDAVLTVDGGILKGDDLFIDGSLVLNANSALDMRDGNHFGSIRIDEQMHVAGTGVTIALSAGEGGAADLVSVGGNLQLDHQLMFHLETVEGYEFAAGNTHALMQIDGGSLGSGGASIAVTGKHADFSYFFGFYAESPQFAVFEAFNNSLSGGTATLDFGLDGEAAQLNYNLGAERGWLEGGRFVGGEVVNLDQVLGTASDDILNFSAAGGLQSLILDGRGGSDTVIYNGLLRQDTTVSLSGNGVVTVTDAGAASDTLISIERIEFDDGALAFDIESANLGFTYRIYAAAYGRTPDEDGLRFWVDVMDQIDANDPGAHKEAFLAVQFLDAPEFTLLYGENPSDEAYIDAMYQNVLNRMPDQDGYDYWVEQMQAGLNRAGILIQFAESPENVSNTSADLSDGVWVI